jgi:retinol dehydrogenase-12
VACRDASRGQAACDKIKLESDSKKVYFEKLDLGSLESIRSFVQSFRGQFSRLDVLINNAGISGVPYGKTKDGFEMNFGVMHLGHFYLTNLLIDVLKTTAPSRVVNVSSLGHTTVKMNWDDLQGEKSYNTYFAYGQAKLANVLFTVELARRLQGTGVTCVSLHPGGVRTDIWREYINGINLRTFLSILLLPVYYLISKDARQGAQTTIHCAVDDSVPDSNGKYFSDCHVTKCSAEATNPEAAKRLWEISEKLVGL